MCSKTPATATVTNVQRFSLHDGGGVRTVAFLKGCPFRCPWCSNPENLSPEPEVALRESLCIHCSRRPGEPCPTAPELCPTKAKELLGERREAQELAAELMRDVTFFKESGGGVTLSGGECLLRQEFSMEVLEFCKESDVNTAVETTLAVALKDPARLVACVDTFLVDFKIADAAQSREVTGLDVTLRDENLRAILALGANVVARMPIIPGYTDSEACVRANIAHIAGLGITRADVLPFHQLGESKYASLGENYELKGQAQLSDEDVAWIVEAAEAAGLTTVIRGE